MSRIAYLTGRYPAITHTFILREVRTLRRLGVDVQSFSIWRTAEQDLLSPADWEEWHGTDALLPPRLSRLVRSHLRAVTWAPRAYLGCIRRALSLSSPGARRRLQALTWFIEAITLWEACRKQDVTHIHAHLDGTAPMVAMLSVEFANANTTEALWSWSQTLHGSKEFYDIHRERLDVRAASARFIACVSDYTRSQVMAFVPEELWHKVVVVRCGVDLDEFAPLRHGSSGEQRILAVGRIDAMKGTVVLLQALAALGQRGLHPLLTVVGDGPSKTKAVELANRLGLEGQVNWAGAIGHDRIRAFYDEADVFCLPSFVEGVPIVLMEAMAMEVPVVANAITGIVELVENGVSGFLIRPGRVDQLSERLAQLLADDKLRKSMGRAGRAKVAAEYDLERNARQLARMLTDGALDCSGDESPTSPPTATQPVTELAR